MAARPRYPAARDALPTRSVVPTRTALLTCFALLASCGGASTPAATGAPTSPGALPVSGDPSNDLGLLAADYFERTLCERLVGRFLPLPAPPPASHGADTGATRHGESPLDPTPASGRLWIRECEAARSENVLQLSLAGVGWAWVDQAESGWRLRQYVSFATTIHLAGVVRPHYDPAARVATLWFVPVATAVPSRNLGVVSTSADSFGAKALDVVTFGLAGSRADERAREKVDGEVKGHFEAQLRQGFTVTFHVPTGRVDSALGHLAPGRQPPRPFPEDGTGLVNERLLLRPEPGGFHVLGPFAPASAIEVELRVEEGPGLRYWTECAELAERRLEGLLRGELLHPERGTATTWLPAPSGRGPALDTAALDTNASGSKEHPATTVHLGTPHCSWYLLTTAAGDAATVSVRVRGRPEVVPTAAPTER